MRARVYAKADEYQEAEEAEECEGIGGAAGDGGSALPLPPLLDILCLDDGGGGRTEASEAAASHAREARDMLDDLLQGPGVRSGTSAGRGDLMSDLLGGSSVLVGATTHSSGHEMPLLLAADKAAGLCVRGSMKQQTGSMVYQLDLTNTTSGVISGLNLMVNKNVYGLQTAPVDVPSLAPGGSEMVWLRLVHDGGKVEVAPLSANAGGSIAQVAVKTSSGVFYYTHTIPLEAVTLPYQVSQQDWLKDWALYPVPGSNSTILNISGFSMHDVDGIEAALKAAHFCVVARRAGNAGATALYMSCKTVAAQIIMCELQVLPSAARVTVKSSEALLSAIAAPAIQALLQNALPANAASNMAASLPNLSGGAGGGGGMMMAASVPAPQAAKAADLLEGLF